MIACRVSRSSSFLGFEAGIFGFTSAMRISVRVDDDVGIERRFKGFSSNEDAGARFVRDLVRRVARALAACQTNRMRHTPDHVRSDLPRNLGQRAVSGAQSSGPPSRRGGPPHHGRLWGGYAAPVAPERRWLQKARPALADARPFR